MKFLNDVILTGAGADLTAPATVTFSGLSLTTETNAVVVNSSGVLSKRALGTSAFTNTYTLPKATSTVRGGAELRSNTVQAVTANNVSSSAGRTYGVQLNSADQMVVNVPWTSLTKATTNILGGIIVGGGLSVSNAGVLSVPDASDTEDGKMLSEDKTKLDEITVSNIVLKDATETISGAKTFSNTIIGDVNGNSATTSERTITSGEISAISANSARAASIVANSAHTASAHAPSDAQANRAISDSVSSTSTTTAASSAAVKNAKDTANLAGTFAVAALPKDGGIMTGALTLSGAPSSNLHAATKAYVDSAVIADTDTQDITQSGNTFTLERGGSVDVSTTTAVAANSLKLGMVLADSVTSTSTTQAGTANATRLAYNNVDVSTLETRLGQINSSITIGNGPAVATTAAGALTATGNLTSPISKIGLRDLDWSGAFENGTAVSVQGDVIYHTITTATTPGVIYYMGTNGNVFAADANALASSTALLVVALGTHAGKGLLLRGMIRLKDNPGAAPGTPIYLSGTAGAATGTAPSATGDVVRVLGYQLTNGNGTLNACYFNPDNTWVELT